MIALILPVILAAPGSAGLHCPVPTADRGEVRTGPPLAHVFRLSNPGPNTVRVIAVEAGCGCLRRDLSRDTLAPGESADLRILVNTLTQPAGPNTWRISLRYQIDPPTEPGQVKLPAITEQQLGLTITARLVQEVTVTPPAVAFSTATGAAQTIRVKDTRPTPLTVVSAAATSPHLTATVRPAGEITVVLSPTYPDGTADETVILTTDDPACPELRVPVRVVKRSATAVTAAPQSITVRFAPGQSALSRLVQLRAGGRPVAIQAADCSNSAVTVTSASAGGPSATVRVSVAADRTPAGSATVRVTLAEPAGETVIIPVHWATDSVGP